MYIVSVKSKLQASDPPLPAPRLTPRIWHLCRHGEEGIWLSVNHLNYIVLASQLHVHSKSVSLSVEKPFKQLA